MSLQIQQARVADLPAIAEIELKIEGAGAATLEVLRERLEMFNEGFLVAKKSGRLLGYAESCRWNEKVPSFQAERNFFTKKHLLDGRTLYLIFLGVDPEYQRQGVASGLLAELLKVAGYLNIEEVQAVTWEYLVPLYVAQGFRAIGQIPDFMPDGIVTHLAMTKAPG